MKGLAVAVVTWAVLVASESCDLNPPGDKTPAGGVPEGVITLIEVTSHPSGALAKVRIDARDHSGLPSVSILTAELYPTEHVRRTPFTEGITHPASATVTYSVDAVLGGEPGDILGCKIYVNGEVPTGPSALEAVHVTQILEGMASTQVSCSYTRYPAAS
jgi:hypothetical protein